MTDEPQNQGEPNDRLEEMLRRWGAEEAHQRAPLPPLPQEAPPTQAPAPPVATAGARYPRQAVAFSEPPERGGGVLAAIAAVLLVGALGVAAWALWGKYRAEADLETVRGIAEPPMATDETGPRPDPDAAQRVRELRDELDVAEERIASLRATTRSAGDARGKLERLEATFASAVAEARERAYEAGRKSVNEKVGELERQLAARAETVEQLRERIGALEGDNERLAAFEAELKKEIAARQLAERKLAALVEEMQRVQQNLSSGHERAQEAEQQLARLRARYNALEREYQKRFLEGEGDAAADVATRPTTRPRTAIAEVATPDSRKQAMKRQRLLERLPAVRKAARQRETEDLLERLEVVLTRLALMDTSRPDAARKLASLVRGGKLTERMEEALAARDAEPASVRQWLLEARMVLKGAGDAQ